MSTPSMRPRIYIRTAVRALAAVTVVLTAALLIAYVGSHVWAVIALIVLLWGSVLLVVARLFIFRRD